MIYPITCRFCHAQTGTLEQADALPVPQFEDTRCDSCLTQHGDFKTMILEHQQTLGSTYHEAKAFLEKSDFKKSVFDKNLKTEVQKMDDIIVNK